jgi:hypothetical protein
VRLQLRFLLLLLPLLTGGCTVFLVNYTDWSNKPAANPHLRLFQAERPKDLLVVYDEYCERTRTTRTCAYLLYKNQNRVELGQSPHFVSTGMTHSLPVVPVFQEPMPPETNSLPGLYAVISTNTESFLIYSNRQMIGTNDLPLYADPVGKEERTALLPFAITVDAALVAGAIYVWIIAPETDTWPRQ